VVFEICERTDRQTDRHTERNTLRAYERRSKNDTTMYYAKVKRWNLCTNNRTGTTTTFTMKL